MKMVFIGTGSAFTISETNFHSNALLIADNGEKMLLDCGSDARRALHRLGYGIADISAVYISHFHADHAGGLEWLGLATFFDPRLKRPRLYIQEGMTERLWNKALYAGMDTFSDPNINLATFFDLHLVGKEGFFTWNGLVCHLVLTIHVEDIEGIIPSYGLFMHSKNKCIFFTTDTKFDPERLLTYYQKADLIFQDCETSSMPSGVHAHYQQLKTLPPEIKQKMYLYHYNDGQLPDANADGFKGFVYPGQFFDIGNV